MAVQQYAPYIQEKPFLMLMGKADERNYTVETAGQLYNLLGTQAKHIEFYESGHMLPSEWTVSGAGWIKKYL
jgi:predicted esterase